MSLIKLTARERDVITSNLDDAQAVQVRRAINLLLDWHATPSPRLLEQANEALCAAVAVDHVLPQLMVEGAPQ